MSGPQKMGCESKIFFERTSEEETTILIQSEDDSFHSLLTEGPSLPKDERVGDGIFVLESLVYHNNFQALGNEIVFLDFLPKEEVPEEALENKNHSFWHELQEKVVSRTNTIPLTIH